MVVSSPVAENTKPSKSHHGTRKMWSLLHACCLCVFSALLFLNEMLIKAVLAGSAHFSF